MSVTPVRMIVADREPEAIVLEAGLESSRPVLAASGESTLSRLRTEKPGLLLFSFDLGDMNGAELCRRVRADDATRSMSLLFMTRHGSNEEIDLCMAAGCNDVIFRPLDPAELQAKIRMFSTIPLRKELRTLAKVEVRTPTQNFFLFGQSVNVSSKGMLLEVERLLPPDAVIHVTFFLPDDAKPLNLDGQVFRAEFGGATPRYGLQFLEIDEADRDRIDRYVQRMHSREAS